MSMASLLGEKGPYIVTLLAAALGWTVKQTEHVLTESPTIAYEMAWTDTSTNHPTVSCMVTNISRTRQFRNLQFEFKRDTSSMPAPAASFVADAAAIDPVAPAYSLEKAEVTVDKTAVAFPVPLLQPGWKMKLSAQASGESPVNLLQMPSIDGEANPEPVRMVRVGLETWIVENEIFCLFALTGLWLAGMIICAIAAR
jgi:hypothetical protein